VVSHGPGGDQPAQRSHRPIADNALATDRRARLPAKAAIWKRIARLLLVVPCERPSSVVRHNRLFGKGEAPWLALGCKNRRCAWRRLAWRPLIGRAAGRRGRRTAALARGRLEEGVEGIGLERLHPSEVDHEGARLCGMGVRAPLPYFSMTGVALLRTLALPTELVAVTATLMRLPTYFEVIVKVFFVAP